LRFQWYFWHCTVLCKKSIKQIWKPDLRKIMYTNPQFVFRRGEGDNRGWDDWMASLTQWTWVWVNSRSWQWTGRPGLLQSMGSQRVAQDWANELNWNDTHTHTHTHTHIWIPTHLHFCVHTISEYNISGWGTRVYLWRIHFNIWQN